MGHADESTQRAGGECWGPTWITTRVRLLDRGVWGLWWYQQAAIERSIFRHHTGTRAHGHKLQPINFSNAFCNFTCFTDFS